MNLAVRRAVTAAGLFLAGLATVISCAATSASAQTAVDLQLVLAVDASGSVSNERFILQQRGYSSAFRNPRLLEAIRSGTIRSIAVTMTQWTGSEQQIQVVPWRRIGDEASMLAFADAIDDAPRQLFGGGTSISGAIDHAMTLFPKSGFMGERRVIDISGDGANNRGRAAAEARDDAVRAGIGINGLADPDPGAEPRPILLGPRDRWTRSIRHSGGDLRHVRRGRSQEARDRSLSWRRRELRGGGRRSLVAIARIWRLKSAAHLRLAAACASRSRRCAARRK